MTTSSFERDLSLSLFVIVLFYFNAMNQMTLSTNSETQINTVGPSFHWEPTASFRIFVDENGRETLQQAWLTIPALPYSKECELTWIDVPREGPGIG